MVMNNSFPLKANLNFIFILNYTDRPLFYDLGIYEFVEDECFIFYYVKIIY